MQLCSKGINERKDSDAIISKEIKTWFSVDRYGHGSHHAICWR
jgi:hypothetical protein